MPSKRQRINRWRIPDLPAEILARFRGEDCPPDGNRFVHAHLADTAYAGHWREHGDDITAEWASRMPGTRPPGWWEYSAPGPRQRVGGSGTPAHEVLAYAPSTDRGIPSTWISDWDIRFYDLGERAQRFDVVDPPTYESEAHFLRRHDLLLPGESRHLTQRDYAPVPLPEALWPRGDE